MRDVKQVSYHDFYPEPRNPMLYQMKYSLAIKQRNIFINDDITDDSILECMYYLHKIIDLDKKSGEKKPVNIYVNSNGGSAYDCLTLISFIEQMKRDGYTINTINTGRAFSAGGWISLVGTNRYAFEYATYMFHTVSSELWGDIQTQRERLEESNRLQEVLNSIISKYTNITQGNIEDMTRQKLDRFYSAQEALEFGIVDKIL